MSTSDSSQSDTTSSDNMRAQYLIERIEQHPVKYRAWESAIQLADLDIAPFYDHILAGLHSSDDFSRECFLEVLARNSDPEIINELNSIFQNGPSERTNLVTSLSRLRAKSNLPDEFYSVIERNSKNNTRRRLNDPLDIVDALPDILFPHENNDYARHLIQKFNDNSRFFEDITKEDISMIHAMFYLDHKDPKNREYRNIRMWDFDSGGSPVLPYDLPFVVPASLPFVMDSYLNKVRNHEQELAFGKHPLQYIGESFYYQEIIHPFFDCNSRTNFLLMNLFLLKSGLPYIKMACSDLSTYHRALKHPEPTKLVEFLGNLILRE